MKKSDIKRTFRLIHRDKARVKNLSKKTILARLTFSNYNLIVIKSYFRTDINIYCVCVPKYEYYKT